MLDLNEPCFVKVEKIEDAKGTKKNPSTQKTSRERSKNADKIQVMEAGAQV